MTTKIEFNSHVKTWLPSRFSESELSIVIPIHSCYCHFFFVWSPNPGEGKIRKKKEENERPISIIDYIIIIVLPPLSVLPPPWKTRAGQLKKVLKRRLKAKRRWKEWVRTKQLAFVYLFIFSTLRFPFFFITFPWLQVLLAKRKRVGGASSRPSLSATIDRCACMWLWVPHTTHPLACPRGARITTHTFRMRRRTARFGRWWAG